MRILEGIKRTKKSCNLRRDYGIRIEDYESMLEAQNFSCAICKQNFTTFTRLLSVDHCHNTGKIRGLLCRNCNTSIGLFQESETIILSALEYLG